MPGKGIAPSQQMRQSLVQSLPEGMWQDASPTSMLLTLGTRAVLWKVLEAESGMW